MRDIRPVMNGLPLQTIIRLSQVIGITALNRPAQTVKSLKAQNRPTSAMKHITGNRRTQVMNSPARKIPFHPPLNRGPAIFRFYLR